MNVRTLVIEAQRAVCDPELIFPQEKSWQRGYYRFLDETAQRIADFVDETRPYSEPIWAIQMEELTKTFRRALTREEAAFHRVRPHESDTVLVKTRWSAVEEHPMFFAELDRQGVDTYVLAGYWAGKCILKNAEDILALGHRVIIPVDLTSDMEALFTPEDYVDIAHHPKLILTEARDVANMLRLPVPERTPPQVKYSPLDIFNLAYGFGS